MQLHFHPVRVAGNAIGNEETVSEYQQRDKADGKAAPRAERYLKEHLGSDTKLRPN